MKNLRYRLANWLSGGEFNRVWIDSVKLEASRKNYELMLSKSEALTQEAIEKLFVVRGSRDYYMDLSRRLSKSLDESQSALQVAEDKLNSYQTGYVVRLEEECRRLRGASGRFNPFK